jgi:hypothetical protein
VISRDPVLMQHYVEKADHFFQAMRLVSEDMSAYASSVALLAIHSSISLNDAIAVGVTGKRSKSEDHKRAATDLDRLCKVRKVTDRKGVQHLAWLLATKTDVAYGERHLDKTFLLATRDRAERFQAWPTITLKRCSVAERRYGILEGRGKNAVAQLLSRKLIVPKIFFDARWPNRTTRVDVLAVDRSGAGDVHVVEIAANRHHLATTIQKLIRIPAQFKYLAYFDLSDEEKPLFDPDSEPDRRLYARDGLGRIGTICLYEGEPGEALSGNVAVEPERFRVPGDLYQEIDRYLDKHTPDIAIRA